MGRDGDHQHRKQGGRVMSLIWKALSSGRLAADTGTGRYLIERCARPATPYWLLRFQRTQAMADKRKATEQ